MENGRSIATAASPLGARRQPVLDAEPRGGESVAQVFEPVRLAFDGPPQFVEPGPVVAVGAEKAADARVWTPQYRQVKIFTMPLELFMWRIDSGFGRVMPVSLDLESRLEDLLDRDISIASPRWMVIGRQVPTPWGKRIDLLCIDIEGQLVVLELKRHMTEREIVAQTLDYGSYIKTIEADEARRIFAKYQKDKNPNSPALTIEEAFKLRFGVAPFPEEINASHELVIVASTLDSATERIVQYLADEYAVHINAIFFRVFKDGDREYLTRAWLRDAESDEGSVSATPRVRERVDFNGEYYVNFGEGDHRNWEDARKFGFVSAGHGPKYRDAIKRLTRGNRIWVNVPGGTGYVGVGIVEEAAVPVKEFTVKNGKGENVPLLQAGIASRNMGEHADDPDMSEYVARVKWIKHVPLSQAVREPGFFGNQNCVAEPRDARWPYTIDRLKQHFGIDT